MKSILGRVACRRTMGRWVIVALGRIATPNEFSVPAQDNSPFLAATSGWLLCCYRLEELTKHY